MKISLYTTDASFKDIVSVKVAHITMFETDTSITFHFVIKDEQIAFIRACIDNYVLIQVQGMNVTLIPKVDNYQRVRFRFDS